MIPRETQGFQAIRIEGGILPADFLNTVAAFTAPRQTEADYRLPKGLKLRDEIGRYWRIAHSLWQDYPARRKREDLDCRIVAVDEWLIPLFTQVLGFADLEATPPRVIGDRVFPATHSACKKSIPFVFTAHSFDLDKSHAAFGEEGRRRSPDGLVQEYLNAEERCLWGVASNGVKLRLLRDNSSLTRPAYVEVDLERLFEEQLYPDFAVFWLIFQASRFDSGDGKPEHCIIESWRKVALETGERALEKLRDGVTRTLRTLGTGFVAHPGNKALREAIDSGTLTAENYFQQLLRLVYRLLFLFTTEERGVLLLPDCDDEAKNLYRTHYSAARLRDLAALKRFYDRHSDLWESLSITFASLATGQPPLALPALGGLFEENQCPDLDASRISNRHLLEAIHSLSFFLSDNFLARINYRDMDTEELGSVYESLLELVPRIHVEFQPWRFGFAGDEQDGAARGSARKLTGSYYTPDSLVQELIQSALVPVIERTLKEHPENPRDALLKLKIVDPAAGSGHFLLAAARRLATDDSTKAFIDAIATKGRLVSLYDFENRKAIFAGVHRSYKFSLITLGSQVKESQFLFFATRVEHLHDATRKFTLSADDIALLNPNTRTCPVFRSQKDAELTKKIYRRAGVFIDENRETNGNAWGIRF